MAFIIDSIRTLQILECIYCLSNEHLNYSGESVSNIYSIKKKPWLTLRLSPDKEKSWPEKNRKKIKKLQISDKRE